MALALFVLGGLALGAAVASALASLSGARRYDDDAAAVLDVLCAAGVCALAVWVATSWALAYAGALRATPLTLAGGIELATGVLWLSRSRSASRRSYRAMSRSTLLATMLALAPVALWVAFVGWRGTILPPYNHDALSYHMPKAVLLVEAHGYRFFDVPETRIATWPWNYELLLADSMILTGGDGWTAALSTFAYVLVILFAARLAAAWWGGGVHVALASAVVATAPVVVLHSGLHKNDLLFSAFALGSFAWSARWAAAGCAASALLAGVALALAIGTKVSGVLVIPPVVVALAIGAWRRRAALRGRGRLAVLALGCPGAALASSMLGSGSYVANVVRAHALFLPTPSVRGYGVWSNIWEFTSMLILAPFAASPDHMTVWNPFHRAYWWWRDNDVWSSHWGAFASSLCLVLGPSLWRYRKDGDARERAFAGLSALFAYVFTLPVDYPPHGFFCGFVRFTVFAIPVVVALTLSPGLLELERRAGRFGTLVKVLPAAGVAAFGVRMLTTFGLHDAYAPLEYVEHVLDHPDNRVPFVRRNRAASVLDTVAPATDACALDVGIDTWVYPAYGRGWTRRVEFLKPAAGDVAIPESADWVAIDRSWNVFFGHPGFADMSQWALIGKGVPTDGDVKVYRQLARDPSFDLVYDDRQENQALFHRKRKPQAPAP